MSDDQHAWTTADDPALRRGLPPPEGFQTDVVHQGPTCPFCGGWSLIKSYGDLAADTERIEVYCTNSDCSARTITILASTQGEAGTRADLNALSAVDEGEHEPGVGLALWSAADLAGYGEAGNDILRRRRGATVPCQCSSCRQARGEA